MPRASLSNSEIEAFRAKVIEAATRLFAESGYDGVTMRGIAVDVGCSPMTPYRYFEDKDEIFALVTAGAYQRFADQQSAAIAELAEPAQKLEALGLAYVRFAMSEPDSYRVMFELRQAARADHPELQAEGERAWQIMHDTVVEAVDAGLIDGDPETAAHTFWAGVHGVVSLYLAGKLQLGRTIEELIPAMMATLLVGMNGHDLVEEKLKWQQ
jgi:AcrR family transcriptional regulator